MTCFSLTPCSSSLSNWSAVFCPDTASLRVDSWTSGVTNSSTSLGGSPLVDESRELDGIASSSAQQRSADNWKYSLNLKFLFAYHVCIKISRQLKGPFIRSNLGFFDLCCPILENTNVKCEHHHLLPQNWFLMFEENTDADATCEQSFNKLILTSARKGDSNCRKNLQSHVLYFCIAQETNSAYFTSSDDNSVQIEGTTSCCVGLGVRTPWVVVKFLTFYTHSHWSQVIIDTKVILVFWK